MKDLMIHFNRINMQKSAQIWLSSHPTTLNIIISNMVNETKRDIKFKIAY